MSNLTVEQWFPTPIWNYKFVSLSDFHYDEAFDFCYKLKTNTPGRVISNVGGWQSNNLWPEDLIKTPLDPFFKEISPLLVELQKDLGIDKTIEYRNTWVNINKKGDSNILHNHPNADISGVFYLSNNNSKIEFAKDNPLMNWWLDSLHSNKQTVFSYQSVEYYPSRGRLLLFPSWLSHSVETHQGDEDRISVAFNIKLHDKI